MENELKDVIAVLSYVSLFFFIFQLCLVPWTCTVMRETSS